jgi:hypothetical protein
MKCKYCETDFPLEGKSKLCPNCESYYQFVDDKGLFYSFNAYPEKDLKKNFQNLKIMVPKE